jgi:hypothetical protein
MFQVCDNIVGNRPYVIYNEVYGTNIKPGPEDTRSSRVRIVKIQHNSVALLTIESKFQ